MPEKNMRTIHREAVITKNVRKSALRRVAAYCRVSTLHEEQGESYETQRAYYHKRIGADPALELVGVYGDYGVSGLSTVKRPEFQRMMDDCMDGKIDFVMTKSVSRFARNLADCVTCVQTLKEKGIPVLFEKEGLNTMAPGCDLMLSILATLAQEESNSISKNLRWAYEYRNAAGNPIYKALYGYRKIDGQWRIHKPEAERVRIAFHMASEGRTYRDIRMELNKLENQDKTGIIWNQQRLYRLLTKETYIGDILTNKTYKPDLLSRKQIKNKGDRHQYYIEGHHDAIVDRSTFEYVSIMISKGQLRTNKQGRIPR